MTTEEQYERWVDRYFKNEDTRKKLRSDGLCFQVWASGYETRDPEVFELRLQVEQLHNEIKNKRVG